MKTARTVRTAITRAARPLPWRRPCQHIQCPAGRIVVHTDASVRRGGGGVAFVARRALDPAPFLAKAWARVRERDVNKLELLAIYVALASLPPWSDVDLYTDSQTALDQLAIADSRRRHPRYSPLVRAVHRLVETRTGVTAFGKVKAHAGDEGNDMADALAKHAASF